MYSLILVLVLRLSSPVVAGGPDTDACRSQVPGLLGEALEKEFPAYRLPTVEDSLAEDIASDRTHGGNGCLLVGVGDFDGDGHEDVAVGLAPKVGRRPLVAVAFRRDNDWAISTVRSWVEDISRQYVTSAPPGVHTRSETVDSALQANERRSLRCDHAAVIVGATESTAIAWCYLDKRWLYVWVSS